VSIADLKLKTGKFLNPNRDKLISTLIVACSEGQATAEEYASGPRPPQELADMLIRLGGLTRDYYSTLDVYLYLTERDVMHARVRSLRLSSAVNSKLD
jgi:hypothetical protein